MIFTLPMLLTFALFRSSSLDNFGHLLDQLIGPPHHKGADRCAHQRQRPQPTLLGEVAADPVGGGRSAAGLGGHAPILPDV